MNPTLFRPEALAACLHPAAGQPLPSLPLRLRYLALAVCALCAGLLILLVLGRYTRKITVPGYVTATAASVRVFPPAQGTVTQVFVDDGDEISSGKPLFEVASAGFAADDGGLTDAIRSELGAVDQRLAASESLFRAREESLAAKHRGAKLNRSYLSQKRRAALERLRLTTSQFERAERSTARQFIAVAELERIKKELLRDKDTLATVQHELAVVASALNQAGTELSELEHAQELERATLWSERRRTETRLRESTHRQRYTINAPVSGRVTALTAMTGKRSEPRRPALSIVPTSTEYEVQLLLPGRALTFVGTGNRVNLRFEAFPFQKFGLQYGQLSKVADSYLLPGELDAPLAVSEAVFPAIVRLDSQHLSFDGKLLQLNSGLLVEADILLDERSLIEWLFEPLLSVVQNR